VPLTPHSLFQTVEGAAAFATFVLAATTFVLAIGTIVTARRTRDLAVETTRLGDDLTTTNELSL
jgi:hypothetical protein